MPTFEFRASADTGAIESGVIEAVDLYDAQRQLRGRRLKPVSIKLSQKLTAKVAAANSGAIAQIDRQTLEKLLQKVSRPARTHSNKGKFHSNDLLRFTSELSVLLKSGLPLDRAIKVQIDSLGESAMGTILSELLGSLKGGKSLSAGLSQVGTLFGVFYINMIRSGEASGRLSEVLGELAAYLERARQIRSAVISALIYPAILAVVAAVSIVVMLGFVVPEFEALFEDMGDTLPMLTRIVVGSGNWVSDWWWLMLAIILSCSALAKRWFSTPAGLQWLDLRALTMPIVGPIVLKYEVARFARTLGTLLRNGVSMLRSVDIAVGTVGNSLIRASLLELQPAIKRGGRLSQALDPRIFPPVAQQMIRVGEESGGLDAMLLELASVSESEVEASIKRSLTVLEPALILGMGGIIAIIIMGILMGILSVNTLVV